MFSQDKLTLEVLLRKLLQLSVYLSIMGHY